MSRIKGCQNSPAAHCLSLFCMFWVSLFQVLIEVQKCRVKYSFQRCSSHPISLALGLFVLLDCSSAWTSKDYRLIQRVICNFVIKFSHVSLLTSNDPVNDLFIPLCQANRFSIRLPFRIWSLGCDPSWLALLNSRCWSLKRLHVSPATLSLSCYFDVYFMFHKLCPSMCFQAVFPIKIVRCKKSLDRWDIDEAKWERWSLISYR